MVTSSSPSAPERPAVSTEPQLAVPPAAVGKAQDTAADDSPLQALPTPAEPSAAFAQQLQQKLLQASWQGAGATSQVLPVALCHHIIKEVHAIVKEEPTMLELTPGGQPVTVVGDTHGHYQDLCHM